MMIFKDYMYINDGINPLRHQKRVINGGMAIVSGDDDNDIEYENSDDEDKSLDALLKRRQKYEIEGAEGDQVYTLTDEEFIKMKNDYFQRQAQHMVGT